MIRWPQGRSGIVERNGIEKLSNAWDPENRERRKVLGIQHTLLGHAFCDPPVTQTPSLECTFRYWNHQWMNPLKILVPLYPLTFHTQENLGRQFRYKWQQHFVSFTPWLTQFSGLVQSINEQQLYVCCTSWVWSLFSLPWNALLSSTGHSHPLTWKWWWN